MTTKKIFFFILISFNVVLASCASPQSTGTIEPSPSSPIETLSPVPTTYTPTDPPTLQPTIVASAGGSVVYDDNKNIISINLATGETKTLISREELKMILGEDKSADSYTYGRDKPIEIELASDLKKARVSICAALDSRFRCVFEDYVYSLEDKSAVKLKLPSDTYGVYWKWSPDSTKLAGAAWTYTDAIYQITRFYSINSDGTNLTALPAITNDNWQIVWHPGNNVILPLTFITNFRSIFVDGSAEMDIAIDGLQWNDKMECLTFSPDASKAAFIIRRDIPKNHDWLYIVRSDFAELSQAAEYDIDSRYGCKINWSPDGSYIHVGYEYVLREETGLATQTDKDLLPLDKVLNLKTGEFLTAPANSRACTWTPKGALVYEKKDITGEGVGIEVASLAGNESVQPPENILAIIRHCPVQWLEGELNLNIPEGISVPNACHPGVVNPDEMEVQPINSLFDILEASSQLDGETLSVVMTFDSASANLASYLTPDVTDFPNGWDVLVDVDNNVLTGDQLGIDYRFSAAVLPENNGTPPSLRSAILKYDAARKTFVQVDELKTSFNFSKKTLTFKGKIPEISQNTRLVFLSRLVDSAAARSVVGDRICE